MQNNVVTTLLDELQVDTDWGLKSASAADWVALWSSIGEICAFHPLREDGTCLWQGATGGPLAGARFATGNQLLKRTQRQALRPNGALMVQYISSGSVAIENDARSFVQREGSVIILDLAEPFKASYQHAVGELIFVPRELLGFSQSDRIEPVILPVQSMQGKMLAAEVRLFCDLTAPQTRDIPYEPNTFLHLLNSVLSSRRHPASDRVEWWRSRNALIRSHIEENLGDLNMLPAKICERFNLSRATLYRMFEIDGGVRRYIQDRRLYAAVWDLAEGGIHRGRLTAVSEKWGFSSNANFNRAVKIVFGMPPGALFRSPALIVPSRLEHRQTEYPVYAWLERLQRQGAMILR
ncbi:MAG: helix-turn-helix domain-containing protein [Pseudomonadota bacterium]